MLKQHLLSTLRYLQAEHRADAPLHAQIVILQLLVERSSEQGIRDLADALARDGIPQIGVCVHGVSITVDCLQCWRAPAPPLKGA